MTPDFDMAAIIINAPAIEAGDLDSTHLSAVAGALLAKLDMKLRTFGCFTSFATVDQLADTIGCRPAQIRDAMLELAAAGHGVLDEDTLVIHHWNTATMTSDRRIPVAIVV